MGPEWRVNGRAAGICLQLCSRDDQRQGPRSQQHRWQEAAAAGGCCLLPPVLSPAGSERRAREPSDLTNLALIFSPREQMELWGN